MSSAFGKGPGSNHDDDLRWYIELDGRVLGELVDPELTDMFWYSYRLISHGAEESDHLNDDESWIQCRFQYRHQRTGKLAAAYAAGPPFIVDGRITMRGLTLR